MGLKYRAPNKKKKRKETCPLDNISHFACSDHWWLVLVREDDTDDPRGLSGKFEASVKRATKTCNLVCNIAAKQVE